MFQSRSVVVPAKTSGSCLRRCWTAHQRPTTTIYVDGVAKVTDHCTTCSLLRARCTPRRVSGERSASGCTRPPSLELAEGRLNLSAAANITAWRGGVRSVPEGTERWPRQRMKHLRVPECPRRSTHATRQLFPCRLAQVATNTNVYVSTTNGERNFTANPRLTPIT